jgi:integrase
VPRKPKPLKKQKVAVSINGKVIDVSLLPPTGDRRSWYAYWPGLISSKSTGQTSLDEAKIAVSDMIQNGSRKSHVDDWVLTDKEFDEIQKRHYSKKKDAAAQKRAEKSLVACMEAISAFRSISGVRPISVATPEDCERFQHEALKLRKDWRVRYADNSQSKKRRARRGEVEHLSPNTILRWSVALKAAFERANKDAGKKCVRGVAPNEKLLTENPWKQFTWIEGREKAKRRFDQTELLSLLDHFENGWPSLSFAPAFLKVCLWSWGRRDEISGLRWDAFRKVGREHHFDSVGKWGVRKWFRIPETLFAELQDLRTESPFVFGAYSQQLKDFHLSRGDGSFACRVKSDFAPDNLGDWMYRQVSRWSKDQPNGSAYLHVFRKTSLQYARRGEDLNRLVASDASLTTAVMMASYADEDDEELRHRSNRTYRRILGSLPVDVACRYGYQEKPSDRLIEKLDLARSQEQWSAVIELADALGKLPAQEAASSSSSA